MLALQIGQVLGGAVGGGIIFGVATVVRNFAVKASTIDFANLANQPTEGRCVMIPPGAKTFAKAIVIMVLAAAGAAALFEGFQASYNGGHRYSGASSWRLGRSSFTERGSIAGKDCPGEPPRGDRGVMTIEGSALV
jgi:hypothetical protein